jgi:hypothetical protein
VALTEAPSEILQEKKENEQRLGRVLSPERLSLSLRFTTSEKSDAMMT